MIVAELSGFLAITDPNAAPWIDQLTTLGPGLVVTLALVVPPGRTVAGVNLIAGPISTSCMRSQPSAKQPGLAVIAALTLTCPAVFPAPKSAGFP